jgi:hypothetical protein
MRSRVQGLVGVCVGGATVAILSLAVGPLAGQTPAGPQVPVPGQFPAYTPPRGADGRPDLNGIWQAFVTANIDVQDHDAQPGPYPEVMGAYGSWPAGQGIVEGGEIPYRPEALAKKRENAANRMKVAIFSDDRRHLTGDPELKCYRPGLPRANYMPFPFQIVQSQDKIVILHEYATEAPAESWMGWSNGKWDGNSLVIDTSGFVAYTWFDRAGNHHSDALRVVERYTPVSPYHMNYEATIEDAKVFTRPWKVSFPLYRRMERNVQLLDFNCVPFVEDMLYDHLRKEPKRPVAP